MLASNTYTEESLDALFLFWVAITVAAAAAMYWVLLKIEAQIAADMLNSYAEGAGNLELSVEDNKQKNYTSMDSPSKKKQLELEVEKLQEKDVIYVRRSDDGSCRWKCGERFAHSSACSLGRSRTS